MLINAQPRVVSVSGSRSCSFTPHNRPRKSQGLFEMSSNNANTPCAATSAVSAALTNEAWDWGLENLDQENYSTPFDSSVYSDVHQESDAASYYGQRTTVPVAMAAETQVTQPAPYVYGQAQAYYYAGARNTYTSSSAAHQYYNTTSGFCRPSNIHKDGKADTEQSSRAFDLSPYSSQVVTSEPSPYAQSVNYTASISPAYLTTTAPQSVQYSQPKGWSSVFQEPALRGMGSSDVSISPSPGSSELLSNLGGNWSNISSFDSSPPDEPPLSYQSYSFSDTSFSDSESEHTSGEHGDSRILPSQHQRSRRDSFEAEVEADEKRRREQSYISIAPNPSSWSSINPTSSQSSSRRVRNAVSPLREDKDDFLITHKRAGLSYKEIRRLGRFKEAESTLRGRYRTLTKSKEERVRRPNWTEKDLRLLRIGVGLFGGPAPGKGDGSEKTMGGYQKVKWMKVADYIKERGGSYRFGNATCRKKWDELVAKGEI